MKKWLLDDGNIYIVYFIITLGLLYYALVTS